MQISALTILWKGSPGNNAVKREASMIFAQVIEKASEINLDSVSLLAYAR